MLRFVRHFFVQNEDSKLLLANRGIHNVSVSGDTRFDRVWVNAEQAKSFAKVEEFCAGHLVFIAGSTWPEDEKLIAELIVDHPDWKFIIAPHEISEEKISKLTELLSPGSFIRYSHLTAQSSSQTLIIDNIGMLSSLYQYGDMAYIGGGFGVGIHNILEAAAFGLPVIFGPNYEKFKEAREMIAARTGFSINDANELKKITAYLAGDEHRYQAISQKIKAYIREHIGATEMIMEYIGDQKSKEQLS
jgi:3-deoxy-D-manno-octulosonic-acid transferase